jgi:hypothetical protein
VLLDADALVVHLVVEATAGVVVPRGVARRDVERHVQAAGDLVEDHEPSTLPIRSHRRGVRAPADPRRQPVRGDPDRRGQDAGDRHDLPRRGRPLGRPRRAPGPRQGTPRAGGRQAPRHRARRADGHLLGGPQAQGPRLRRHGRGHPEHLEEGVRPRARRSDHRRRGAHGPRRGRRDVPPVHRRRQGGEPATSASSG